MRRKNFKLDFRMFILFLCLIVFTSCEKDEKQTFVIRYKDGEQTIPVSVVLDYKKQLEYVINMSPRSPAKSVTLYDFKQRTIAYKDLTNNECFLGRLTHETLTEETSALQHIHNPVEGRAKVRSLDPGTPALTPTEIRNIAGQKTAVFCRKMNTWLLMPDTTHGIKKRETDGEIGEQAHQQDGFKNVQHSHYWKRTEQRYGSPKRKQKHDSHKTKNADASEGIRVPDITYLPRNHPISYSSSNNPSSHKIEDDSMEGMSDYLNDERHFDSKNENAAESPNNKNSDADLKSKFPRHGPNFFGFEANIPSTHEKSSEFDWSILKDPKKDENILDLSKNMRGEASSRHASENSVYKRTRRSTSTTDEPENQFNNFPTAHPLHLLHPYKPLSQEFEYDSSNLQENNSPYNSDKDNAQSSSIELESGPHNQPLHPRFFDSVGDSDNWIDPDVSTNVLEVPKQTKEFENIKHYRHHQEIGENVSSDSNNNHKTQFNIHHQEQKPDASLRSSNQIPKGNVEISNTGQIFSPNRFPEEIVSLEERNPYPQSNENFGDRNWTSLNSSRVSHSHEILSEDIHIIIDTENDADKNEENSFPHFNHRSDIPSEVYTGRPPILEANVSDSQRVDFNITEGEGHKPYKIRYQSILQNFKPEEIVIDIENVPTHTPPPITLRFQQRVQTTIQPIIRSFSFESVRSENERQGENTLDTTVQSFVTSTTTTLRPRRRNDRTRRPTYVDPNFARNSLRNLDQEQDLQSGQYNGIHRLRKNQRANRNGHIIYAAQQKSHSHSDTSQKPQNFNHINNLPPGVSMHPRHPQAPFADMVHSNRPPSIPYVEQHQPYLQPHHLRHQRKKERNSCCRHRGKHGLMQNCCRNGGPCCSRYNSRSQAPDSNCCSPPGIFDTTITTNQIQPQILTVKTSHRRSNHLQTRNRLQHQIEKSPIVLNPSHPHLRPTTHIDPQVKFKNEIERPLRSDSLADDGDRCEKAKMCRTLFESTQKVMVCRNAHIEGC